MPQRSATPPARVRRGRPVDVRKRSEILAQARRMFADHGVDAVCMDALADAAGVSKTTVYNHFRSKDLLFQALLQDLLDRLPTPDRIVVRGDGPLRPCLLAIGGAICANATSRLMQDIRELTSDAGAASCLPRGAFWNQCTAPYRAKFAEMLRDCATRDRLEIADPAQATSQFFALVASEPFLRLATGARPMTRAARERHVEAAVDTFLRAFQRLPRKIGKATS